MVEMQVVQELCLVVMVNTHLLEPWDEDPEFESPVAFWVRIWKKKESEIRIRFERN